MAATPERRSSYGPASPTVGHRGAAKRQRILSAALERFSTAGYHATAMEDIAEAISGSRSSVYQYFGSKEQIFTELVQESGSALHAASRKIGPLGPDATGFANLRGWLDDWVDAFDRYTAVFVEWANVNSPKTPLRPEMDQFVKAHTRRLAEAFSETDVDPVIAAIVVTGVVDRYHYMRAVHELPLSDDDLLANLAVAIQLLLFPATPKALLSPITSRVARTPPGLPPPIPPEIDRFADLGDQPRATVEKLLDAASSVFAEYGRTGSSVNRIVTKAGVARGTAYEYFSNGDDLFGVLAQECGRELGTFCAELAAVSPGDSLRQWLSRFLEIRDRYAGVLRAWTMLSSDDERVDEARDLVTGHVFFGFGQLHQREAAPIAPARHAATIMLLALLERVPDVAAGAGSGHSREELIDIQAIFVERALLGHSETGG